MKQLSQLLKAINVVKIVGDTNCQVSEIVSDSRKAVDSSMFVAVRGVNVDSHQYIPQLSGKGLAAIVCEKLPEQLDESVTYVQV